MLPPNPERSPTASNPSTPGQELRALRWRSVLEGVACLEMACLSASSRASSLQDMARQRSALSGRPLLECLHTEFWDRIRGMVAFFLSTVVSGGLLAHQAVHGSMLAATGLLAVTVLALVVPSALRRHLATEARVQG